jgi:DNA-directed RNA polymerase specialized sigma24 family protein
MKDNKVLLEEVIRMIDMSEYNSKEKEFLKENVTKRYLKEEDDIDFSDFFDDEEGGLKGDVDSKESAETEEEKLEKFKRQGYWKAYENRKKELEKFTASEDISVLDKLLLTYNSMTAAQAALFELQKDDLVKIKDLSTDTVRPEEEGGREGALYFKKDKPLYKLSDRKEFDRLAERGRFVLKVKGENDETIDRPLYQWLATRKNNLIKLRPGTKYASEANAQLNFLARILSNNPKDEIEQLILSDNGQAAKSNAFSIMQSYYRIVCNNIFRELYQLENSYVIDDAIEDGITSALANLMGTKGYVGKFTRMEVTSWNPIRNVSPWFIEVVKNNLKDTLERDVVDYVPKIDSSLDEFIKRKLKTNSKGNKILVIYSKVSSKSLAFVKEETNEKGVKTYKYIYSDSKDMTAEDKFIKDFKEQSNHLKAQNLYKTDREMLYGASRKADVRMDDEKFDELQSASNIDDALGIIYNIDVKSNDIKNILSNALDYMAKKGGVAGITAGTHGMDEFRIDDEKELKRLSKEDPEKAKDFKDKLIRRKKLAREMVINFMYNFLLSSIESNSPYIEKRTGEKQGGRGKGVESEALEMWIKDQNKMLANEIIKLEQNINPNLKSEEIVKKLQDLKITLKDDDKTRQDIKNGLKKYLESNPSDLRKLVDDIKNMPTAGYDVEVGSEPILERKLREKIQNILKERFTILQEEEDDLGFLSGDINKQLEVYKNSLSDLFSSGTYNTEKLTNIVKQIIETGQAPKNLNSENLAAHKGVYNFIITMLASVYGNLNTSEKRNVISYIFVSAFPRGENSNFINYLMSVAKLTPSSRVRDMVWDAILGGAKNLTSIERALNNYTPDKKNFNNFLITIIRNEIVDLLRKSKDTRTGYLEDPIGSSEEGDSNTLLDKLGDESEYQQRYGSDDEDVIKIANSLKKFMKENLSKKEFEMFLLLKDDEVSGTGRTGKTKFNISMAATALDISNVNARVIKSRLTDKLEKFIESGELREFVLNETGLDISGYTKIQNYLDNKLDKLESDSEENEEIKDDYYSDEEEDSDLNIEDEDFGDDN